MLAGDTFKRTSEHRWIIDPAEPEHFSRLLLEGGWSGTNPLRGVIRWSLDVATIGRESVGTTVTPDLLGPGAVLHLVQSLATAQAIGSGSLWLVTLGAQTVNGAEPVEELRPRAAGLWGLASVIAIEQPDLKVRLVDLDPGEARASGAGLIKELLESTQPRIAIRGTQRLVSRLRRYGHAGAVLGERRDGWLLRVEMVQPGTLDGLELQSCASAPLRLDEVRLRVLTAGINFRDVLIALGMYPGADVPLGAECAGVVTEIGAAVTEFRVGDRVIGFAPASLATEAIVLAAFLAPLPEGMNAENAAGLPVAFLTAYYGLQRLARLRRGERVLIHAAAGGVGLAAVQLVQRQGGEVFATAGSPAKRELLRKMGVQHVMDSRSLASPELVAAEQPQRTDTAPELAGKQILVVDDDIRNLFAIASLLERHRVIVLPARNAREAIDTLQKHPAVDLILMDIMMPEMDGYQATREIRSIERFATVPIIAVTAKAMPEDREKCIAAGCTDFLPKPVENDRLLSCLRRLLAREGSGE